LAPGENVMNEASAFLRRLIPFPGADMPPLAATPLPSPADALSSDLVATAQNVVDQHAASIVSRAASILDEEMAKGVLAASGVAGASSGRADAANPLLRQAHEFVDNLARIWPGLQGAVASPAAGRTSSATESVAEIGPHAAVRPGQRATIAMAIRNHEGRAVRIVPVATDLIGSRGGRIASALLDVAPPELTLEPGQEMDVTISTIVPADAAAGCYSGLLVARGIEYVRALITIDVV
jgi:hypothetical protein